MANSAATLNSPSPFPLGFALQDGGILNKVLSANQSSSQTTINVTGITRATAWQIDAVFNNFTTVAASAIALLPPASPGSIVVVFNNGANTLTFNGFVASDTIDGAASATLSTANRAVLLFCVAAGVWISGLLGATSS